MRTAMRWLDRTGLKHDDAVCAQTMPFSFMMQNSITRAETCHHVMLPISCLFPGQSMPIFRGGPLRSG